MDAETAVQRREGVVMVIFAVEELANEILLVLERVKF